MSLDKWFDKGMSAQDYIEAMEVNQQTLLSIYQGYHIGDQAQQSMAHLTGEGIKAVVLTADWCGDAMVNVPIFLKLAQEALMDVRFLIRDENLELMDQYLTNGRARSIPIIVFLNKDGNELGKWGPRAEVVEEIVADWKKELPEQGTEAYKHVFKETFLPKMHDLFKQEKTWRIIESDLIKKMSKLVTNK